MGFERGTVEDVDDKENPKDAIIQLIVRRAQPMDPELLKGMTLKELKKKAYDMGFERGTVEDVDDKENPKDAIIQLIVGRAQPMDLELFKGMTLKELKKKAYEIGFERGTVEDV